MEGGHWVRKPSGPLSVVFLHGILSNAEGCWKHENGTYWPDFLCKEATLSGVGIYVFQYKTGFFSGSYNLRNVVDSLSNYLRLDKVRASKQLIFVCHSMGGIVARRLIVQENIELIEEKKDIGLFLMASPSLGAHYATWLQPLAEFLGHSQAQALAFSKDNYWLNDLDSDFLDLKEGGRLVIRGKELVEDNFIVFKRLLRRQVVEPFSGHKYFGKSLKVADSDHFSICKVSGAQAIQHKLLVEFISEFQAPPDSHDAAIGSISTAAAPHIGVPSLRFADELHADIVTCQAAISEISKGQIEPEIIWPAETLRWLDKFDSLTAEAMNHQQEDSLFHGEEPQDVANFVTSVRNAKEKAMKIRAGAPKRSVKLVQGMTEYWTLALENVIARSLANFLTLCNLDMFRDILYLLSRARPLYEAHYPKAYDRWITMESAEVNREVFGFTDEVCHAKLHRISGAEIEYRYFWGPREDVLACTTRQQGEPLRGAWFDRYLIPQNELWLLLQSPNTTFTYDETVAAIKVLDSSGKEIA